MLFMKLLTTLKKKINQTLIETKVDKLILYRGVESEEQDPQNNDYAFFAKDESFAKDYGPYIWKCYFGKLNLFVGYKLKYLKELYDNGYKLRDEYVEFMWDDLKNELEGIYDYNTPDDGYKSAEAVGSSPYFGSDTWEMIEKSHGVIDYILSKYDGVVLLEGGEVTYYLDTNKVLKCELVGSPDEE